MGNNVTATMHAGSACCSRLLSLWEWCLMKAAMWGFIEGSMDRAVISEIKSRSKEVSRTERGETEERVVTGSEFRVGHRSLGGGQSLTWRQLKRQERQGLTWRQLKRQDRQGALVDKPNVGWRQGWQGLSIGVLRVWWWQRRQVFVWYIESPVATGVIEGLGGVTKSRGVMSLVEVVGRGDEKWRWRGGG